MFTEFHICIICDMHNAEKHMNNTLTKIEITSSKGKEIMFIPLFRFTNRNPIDELYSSTQPDKQSSYLIMISSHLNLHYLCCLIFT